MYSGSSRLLLFGFRHHRLPKAGALGRKAVGRPQHRAREALEATCEPEEYVPTVGAGTPQASTHEDTICLHQAREARAAGSPGQTSRLSYVKRRGL